MQTREAIQKIISRTAESLAYPRTKHLCTTCGRYIRSFCSIGMEITHGEYFTEILSNHISQEWDSNVDLPGISISITTCTKYKKERRQT